MKALTCPLRCYEWITRHLGAAILTLLLLFVRVIWGYGFFIAGHGKLMDIAKPIAFFTSLHIPFPVENAWFIACLETFGGILLLLGLFSRPIAFLLTCNMIVASLTTEQSALNSLWNDSDPTAIFQAVPFWFLVTSLLVLALGPGKISLDALIKWSLKKFNPPTPATRVPPP